MQRNEAGTEAIIEQAAQWLVTLSDESQDQRVVMSQYQHWKQADPRHAEAASNMERFLERIHSMDEWGADKSPLINASLKAGIQSSARSAKTGVWPVLAIMFVLLPSWLLWQFFPPAYLFADIHTASGEWHQQVLADGSHISLGSHSAVDLQFDARQRTVNLISGDIWVDVAKDAERPFVIQTRYGEIRALGTRFIVRDEEEQIRLMMIESSVQVSNQQRHGVVNAGQQMVFDQQRLGAIEAINSASIDAAWQSKVLMVEGVPLANVLRELDRYRKGKLVFNDSALAGLTVSAVLPLDDTDKALSLLQARYPQLALYSLSPYLTYLSTE